ncbi:MAG: DUF4423 domain-containing protein, partial [Polyangiales bacterium]
AVSRVLAGKTEPRLPTFFRLVDAASRRLLDLLSGLVDLDEVPSAREEWHRLDSIRRLTAGNPLFELVPRALELDAYTHHRPGWLAERLGISMEEEERTLNDLHAARLIEWDGSRWCVDRERSVDTTRLDRAAGMSLQAHWAELAAARIRADDINKCAYLVFTADEETLSELAELHLRYFRELRALIASTQANTRIAVANMHLFTIATADVDPGAA